MDEELPVRASAIEALCAITRERFGYSVDMDKENAERVANKFKTLRLNQKEEKEDK